MTSFEDSLRKVAIVMEGAYGDLAAAVGVRAAGGQPGRTFAQEDIDLRAAAEKYLLSDAFPEPPDYEMEIRSIRRGL